MIRSFYHKGLKQLFLTGRSRYVRADLLERCLIRLEALDHAIRPEDMNIAGFDFHKLHGSPARYIVHVNGPWCITFEFIDGDAYRVDLENYH